MVCHLPGGVLDAGMPPLPADLSGVCIVWSFNPVPPFLRMLMAHASMNSLPQGKIPPCHSGTSCSTPGHSRGTAVTKPHSAVLRAPSPLLERKVCHQLSLMASTVSAKWMALLPAPLPVVAGEDPEGPSLFIGHHRDRCISDLHRWHFSLFPSGPRGFPLEDLPEPLPFPFFEARYVRAASPGSFS